MIGLELDITGGGELHLSSPSNIQSPRPTHHEMQSNVSSESAAVGDRPSRFDLL